MPLRIYEIVEPTVAHKPLNIKFSGTVRFDGHVTLNTNKACNGTDGIGHIAIFRNDGVRTQHFADLGQEMIDGGSDSDDRMMK